MSILANLSNFFSKKRRNIYEMACVYLILLVSLLLILVKISLTDLKLLVMRIFSPKQSIEKSKGFYIVESPTPSLQFSAKSLGIAALAIVLSNLFTYSMFNPGSAKPATEESVSLYLLDEASVYVADVSGFEQKVRDVGEALNVPAEWLMAIMYSESKFDASVTNFKGSGATGLIQWMPISAKELGITLQQLKNLNHLDQLDYVYQYLQTARERYGEYETLTDLYLAVLFPKALDEDYCYALYAKPSRAYTQNSGLDENKDGRVTVSDIDRRMKRIFPDAYFVEK